MISIVPADDPSAQLPAPFQAIFTAGSQLRRPGAVSFTTFPGVPSAQLWDTLTMSKRQQDITDEQFKQLLREISKRFAIAGGVVILIGLAIIALVYLLGGAH